MKLRSYEPMTLCATPAAPAASHITPTTREAVSACAAGVSAPFPPGRAGVLGMCEAMDDQPAAGAPEAAPAATSAADLRWCGQRSLARAAWERWLAEAADHAQAFPTQPGPGRPRMAALACLRALDLRVMRRLAAQFERGHDTASTSAAVETYAAREDCPTEFRAWCASRHSRHHLPKELADALALPARVLARLRAPGRERLAHAGHAPGTLRAIVDERTGEVRRPWAGECWSADDGTINALMHVPWGLGGDPCSDRWGVRVGRFQLLLIEDTGTMMITGWAWVVRGRDSYRAEDVAGLLYRVALGHGAPERIILEKGVWASGRVTDTCAALGMEITRSHRPTSKPVETEFNRLWTLSSALPGVQMGRFRGGNEEGDADLRRLRAGRVDPRTCCLSMQEMDRRVAGLVHQLNTRRVEGRYGTWVPAERWAADVAGGRARLHPIDADTAWVAAPDRRVLRVRQGGHVRCEVDSGFGAVVVDWRHAALADHVGADVSVFFDPHVDGCPAAFVLETPRAGRVVLAAGVPSCTGRVDLAHAAELGAREGVIRAVRAIRPDGSFAARSDEMLVPQSRVQSVPADRGEGAAVPAPAHRGRIAATPEPDLAEVEAAERRAQDAGLVRSW